MQIIEVTWGMAFKVWWSMFWRNILLVLVATFAIGFVVGLIGKLLQLEQATILLSSSLVGFITGLFGALWILKKILYKRYSNFSVVCIANEPVQPQQPHL